MAGLGQHNLSAQLPSCLVHPLLLSSSNYPLHESFCRLRHEVNISYSETYYYGLSSTCGGGSDGWLDTDCVFVFAILFKFGRLSFVLDDSLLPKPFSIQSSAFLFFFSIKLKAIHSLRNRCFYMYRYVRTFHKLIFSNVCLPRKIKQLYYIFSVSNGNYMGYFKWKIFYEPHYRDSRSFL